MHLQSIPSSLKSALRLASLSALLISTLAPCTALADAVLGGDKNKIALGSGYDPERGRFLDECVAGEAQQYRGGSGVITSHYSADIDTLKRTITKDLGVGVNLLVFSHNTTIDYFHRVASSTNRESTILDFTVQTGSDYLSLNSPLSNFGQDVARDLSAFERRKQCGTQFVRQVDLGYRFFLALTATFESTDDHEYFKRTSRTSVLFGLIKKTSTSIREIKKYGKNVVIEVQASQEGGRQEVLKGLLQKKRACTGDEVEQCLELVDSLLTYAQDTKKGLAAQIDPSAPYDPNDASGPSVLRYVTSSYEDAGIDELQTANAPADINAAQKLAEQRIVQILGELISNQQKVAALLVTPLVEDVRRLRLNYLRSALHDLETVARLALDECAADRAELCLEREVYLLDKTKGLDLSAIESG